MASVVISIVAGKISSASTVDLAIGAGAPAADPVRTICCGIRSSRRRLFFTSSESPAMCMECDGHP